MRQSLVQRKRIKAIAAAVVLTLSGILGYVPSAVMGTAVTALDFMVEKMTATPLSDSQRTELSNECRRVIEEPTKRGFRVKLII